MLDIELERSAEERESAKEKQLEAEFGQTLEVMLFLVHIRSQTVDLQSKCPCFLIYLAA